MNCVAAIRRNTFLCVLRGALFILEKKMENTENGYALLFVRYYGVEFSSQIERKTYEDEAQAQMFSLAHSERLSECVGEDKAANLLFFMNAANAVACKIGALVTFELYEEEKRLIATISYENDRLAVIENDALKHFTTLSGTATSIEIDFIHPNVIVAATFCLK